MKTSDYVINRLAYLPYGYVFTYKQFLSEHHSKDAIIKHLNRLYQSQVLGKVTRGRYYKPETTPTGSRVSPRYTEIIKDLLSHHGKLTGYVTGTSYFDTVGLSYWWDISNILIATNHPRAPIKRIEYNITFIKQNNKVTKSNIHLLQFLDAIKLINDIPESSVNKASLKLMKMIILFSKEAREQLPKLALKYNPFVRALLGAFLERTNYKNNLEQLHSSLNPLTSYVLDIPETTLPNAKYWNIQSFSE